MCVCFFHDNFGRTKLYAVKKWVVVATKGPTLFDSIPDAEVFSKVLNEIIDQQPLEDIIRMGCCATEGWLKSDDIAMVLRVVDEVNDNNALAPENVPEANANTGNIFNAKWGHSNLSNRKLAACCNHQKK